MSMDRAHSAWRSAESIKKLSDRVIGVGPFTIGLDGLLTWIPGAGIVYSAGAAMFLLATALGGGASLGTLARMAGYLGLDVLSSDFPIPGVADLFDTFWQGHLMAANALQKDIEARHGPPPEQALARAARASRPRGRGFGRLALLALAAFGLAVYLSDFRQLAGQGWGRAFSEAVLTLPAREIGCGLGALCGGATVTVPGLTLGLPLLAILTGLLVAGLLIQRGQSRRRA